MRYKWLNRDTRQELILFFNGWGSDENPFLHLNCCGYDVVMLYDYKSLRIEDDLLLELKKYSKTYLISWSFGVWVSQCCCERYNLKPVFKVAINGTCCPVNDLQGIPVDVVNGTLEKFDERNLKKFQQRMVGGRKEYEHFLTIKPQRGLIDQKTELQQLINHFQKPLLGKMVFDKVIVGMKDAIFSPQNQMNYWGKIGRLIQMDVPHYCFLTFISWQELFS